MKPLPPLPAGNVIADYPLTTDEFAALHRVKRESVATRLSRTGSFHGIRPLKLASGRVFWPNLAATSEGHQPQPINQGGLNHA